MEPATRPDSPPSRDLIDWKKEGCILRRDPSSPITRYNIAMNWILRENELRSAGELKKVHGRFLGAYHAYPNAGYEEGPAVIGLCWSDDLRQWQIDPPCLRPEDGADWENGGLYKPCLVENRGTYYLFYNAKTKTPARAGRRWREQTGVATSTDLKNWKRYEGNPIIANGPREAATNASPAIPASSSTASWVFFYYSLDANGKARDLLALGHDPFHAVEGQRDPDRRRSRRDRWIPLTPTSPPYLPRRRALPLLLRRLRQVAERSARHLRGALAALVGASRDSIARYDESRPGHRADSLPHLHPPRHSAR